jgi:hypothetical protein
MIQEKSSEDFVESISIKENELVNNGKEELTEQDKKFLSKYDGIMNAIGIIMLVSVFMQFSYLGGEVILIVVVIVIIYFIIVDLFLGKTINKLKILLEKREAINKLKDKDQL